MRLLAGGGCDPRRGSQLPIQSRADMKEIIDRLYIGDIQLAATVLSNDHHMGITHVLSLVSSSILSSFCTACTAPALVVHADRQPLFAHFEVANRGARLLRMVLPLDDKTEQNILDALQPCFDFIDEGRQQGSVLVHCIAGVSRSAAVVTAYLMKTLKLPLQEALELLRKNHKKAAPNPGFMRQLQLFGKQNFSVGSRQVTKNPQQVNKNLQQAEGNLRSEGESELLRLNGLPVKLSVPIKGLAY